MLGLIVFFAPWCHVLGLFFVVVFCPLVPCIRLFLLLLFFVPLCHVLGLVVFCCCFSTWCHVLGLIVLVVKVQNFRNLINNFH